MASAQTGSGKTAAFVLPILNRLLEPSDRPGNGPRVLVLTPTRELTTQIEADIRKFSKFCKLRSGSVVGGVSYGPQIKLLNQPFDLLVATPGRLTDHMEAGRVDFSRLELLVLDEADRMLDLGFKKDLTKIVSATPASRQTLLFSATLEGEVLSIAERFTRAPVRIHLASNRRKHADIRQVAFQADDAMHKHALLKHHLDHPSVEQAVIFTRTKRGADRLAKKLNQEGHRCAALHGDMRQGARQRTIDMMKAGKVRILVATDVAARGLDIKGISHVYNYDLPMVAEDYIHRIGRTGRAGNTGFAISYVGPDDWKLLKEIERLTREPLNREVVFGMEPTRREPARFQRRDDSQQNRGGRSGRGGPRGQKPGGNFHPSKRRGKGGARRKPAGSRG